MKELLKKIGLVRASIGGVNKNAKNTHFNYMFQSWEDVLEKVRSACDEHGLVILPSVVDVQQNNARSIVSYRFTVADIHSGESVDLDWVGEADDKQDKGINKAGTAAYKYFCLKMFQITTKDEEDPDSTGNTVAKPVGEYQLPVPNVSAVEKAAEKAGISMETLTEVCKTRKVSTAAKVKEVLKELQEQAS